MSIRNTRRKKIEENENEKEKQDKMIYANSKQIQLFLTCLMVLIVTLMINPSEQKDDNELHFKEDNKGLVKPEETIDSEDSSSYDSNESNRRDMMDPFNFWPSRLFDEIFKMVPKNIPTQEFQKSEERFMRDGKGYIKECTVRRIDESRST